METTTEKPSTPSASNNLTADQEPVNHSPGSGGDSSSNRDKNLDFEEIDSEDASRCRRLQKNVQTFCSANHFLIAFVVAILLARAYPPLGAVYVAPKITATWVAVIIIFFLSGLNLKSSEFKYAFKQVGFNFYIQFYNFIVVSAVVYGISRGLAAANILSQELADGMLICSCLSVSINVAIVLTKASNGDEAAAIFDAAFGNLVGVFLSPVLILMYLQQWGDVDLVDIFYKLSMKVLVPIFVGQLLQKTCQSVVDFIEKYKKYFGRLQEYSLIFIIYTVFAKQFMSGSDNSFLDILYLIIFTFISMVIVMVGAWYSLKFFFQDKPKLRVMGLFGCTHKTISIGVPLISALYENSPNTGLYTLPLIIWYPMQVMVGTFLIRRLQAFIRNETARLAGTEADESQDDDDAEFDELYEVGADAELGNGAMPAAIEDGTYTATPIAPSDEATVLEHMADVESGEVAMGELDDVPLTSSAVLSQRSDQEK